MSNVYDSFQEYRVSSTARALAVARISVRSYQVAGRTVAQRLDDRACADPVGQLSRRPSKADKLQRALEDMAPSISKRRRSRGSLSGRVRKLEKCRQALSSGLGLFVPGLAALSRAEVEENANGELVCSTWAEA